MLIWQGALAFEQWTGHPAPVDAMRAAAAAHFAARERKNGSAGRRCDRCVSPPGRGRRRHFDAQCLPAAPSRRRPPGLLQTAVRFTFPADYVRRAAAPARNGDAGRRVDDKVVGYLYGDTSPALETNATFSFARFYIHHLVVAPEAQGRGCGAALIQAATHGQPRGLGAPGAERSGTSTARRAVFRAPGVCRTTTTVCGSKESERDNP